MVFGLGLAVRFGSLLILNMFLATRAQLQRIYNARSIGSIAVIGGGFAGMGIAHELCQYADKLDVFDVCPIGKAHASAAAGGLIHPFAPKGGFLWQGREGFQATMDVLQNLQNFKRNENIILHSGNISPIYRPVFKEEDWKHWKQMCLNFPDCVEEVSTRSFLLSLSGPDNLYDIEVERLMGVVALKTSVTIHSQSYLQQIWNYVQEQCPSTTWHQILCTPELLKNQVIKNYDLVVIAGGYASTLFFNDETSLNANYVRGRNIHYRLKSVDPKQFLLGCHQKFPILSGEYIVPRGVNNMLEYELVAGATNEHILIQSNTTIMETLRYSETNNLKNDTESIQDAQTLLQERLLALNPFLLKDYSPTKVATGIRLVTQRSNLGRLPIVGRHSDRIWTLTGLGSRGLLYHALMAKYLRQAIVGNDETLIPSVLHPTIHMKGKKSKTSGRQS